jgi:hypothetical protein
MSGTGLVRVRSPLLTESRLMSFPPGTEMFQFPGFASPKLCVHFGDTFATNYPNSARVDTHEACRPCGSAKIIGEGGFPHSEICGSKVAHTSPQLIAACHVLHRLCMPRHPPIALTSRLRIHTTNDRFGTRCRRRAGYFHKVLRALCATRCSSPRGGATLS